MPTIFGVFRNFIATAMEAAAKSTMSHFGSSICSVYTISPLLLAAPDNAETRNTLHGCTLPMSSIGATSWLPCYMLHAASIVLPAASIVTSQLRIVFGGPKSIFPKAVNSFIWLADSLIYVISIAMRLMASFALGDWVNASVK